MEDVILFFIKSFDSAQFRIRSIHRVAFNLFLLFFFFNFAIFVLFITIRRKLDLVPVLSICKRLEGHEKIYIYIHIYLEPEQMLSYSIVQLPRCCSSLFEIKRDSIKRNWDTPRSWQVYERLCEIPDWTQCKSRDLRSCSCTLAKRSLWMRWRLVDSRQSASCK